MKTKKGEMVRNEGEGLNEGAETVGSRYGFLPPIVPIGSGFSPLEGLVRALKVGKDSHLGDTHYKYVHYFPSIAKKTSLSVPDNTIMPRREGFAFESKNSLKKGDTLYAMDVLAGLSDEMTEQTESHYPMIDLACMVYSTAAKVRGHLAGPVLKFKPNKAEKAELLRVDALFAMVARPLCVILTPGTRNALTNYADEALQALWERFQQQMGREGFNIATYMEARGESESQ